MAVSCLLYNGALFKMNQNRALFRTCQAVVCDLDGTLYLENTPFSASVSFLRQVIASGRRLFYFTNNTSRSKQSYMAKLSAMGFPLSDEMLITAAECTFYYLQEQGLGPEIYLIGNQDLHKDFTRNGFVCLSEEQIRQGARARALVLGFDTELTYAKITTGYELLMQPIPFLATHADLLCPMAHGRFIPDVGSFIEMFAAASGKRPVVMGKPSTHAVQTISSRAQVPPQQIAFIGDRLYTDIRMAMNYDMIGVLVLSGETTADMAATSSDRARLIVNSVADLLEAV